MTKFFTHMTSPVGPLLLLSDGEALTGLFLPNHKDGQPVAPTWQENAQATPFPQAILQLEEYFAGKRQEFDLKLQPEGTPFQLKVWAELRKIPHGQTISYGELARRLGNPNGSRAVGLANGKNPLSIIVPCHRVIGATGKLVGYGGGLDCKQALLKLEGQGRRQESLF